MKSAYRVVMAHLSTTLPNHNLAMWKNIWSIKLPPKVKNFLWRVCSHCLPTKDRLIYRWLNDDPACPVCATEMETFAKDCWLAAELSQPSGNLRSITDWVFHILELKNVDSKQLGCMILWAIWHHGNEVLYKITCAIDEFRILVSISMESGSRFPLLNHFQPMKN